MERLHIDLNEHSYDILTGHGLLDQAGTLIRRVWSGSRAVVLTDDTVRDLYGSRLEQSLSAAGISAAVFSVAPGEQSKSMKVLEHLLDFMASHGLTRSDLLIVLGGGVAGDLGGFAAACYMRGIAFVQIPTTLLAQVDSGVGGKTAVNLESGKNLVGAFWQPRLVISDTSLLASLSAREFAGGMAEVIKYGCIFDRSFFAFLEGCSDRSELMERMPYIVHRCCDLKRIVVEEDERDTGRRMLLNFGHTFGHAMETIGSYRRYIHGEAVALGMLLAMAYGRLTGVTEEDPAPALIRLCQRFGLPVSTDIPPSAMAEHMLIDKKADGSRIRLILLKNLGEACVETVTKEELIQRMQQLDAVWGK
ncbi:MAG: 3-dehydroquinate synthase [Firmicutes bacterium]|nr:3-dehydroquinate synthase [Bacillota bacterium]